MLRPGPDLPPRRTAAAFTLVEVLVALAIFALSAILLAGAYVNVLTSYDLVSRGAQTSADLAFARSLVLTEPDRTKLEQGGEFDTAAGRRAKWSVEILSTTTADLFTVNFTCEISDPTATEPEKTVETFTLLRPTWSIDPAERSKLREDAKTRIFDLQGKKKSGAFDFRFSIFDRITLVPAGRRVVSPRESKIENREFAAASPCSKSSSRWRSSR
jgi:prepilin-type N-terminal cleavage/methylation domain-containing protein